MIVLETVSRDGPQSVRNSYRFMSTIPTCTLGDALECPVWNLTLEVFFDALQRLSNAGGGGVLALCFLGSGGEAEFGTEGVFAG